MAMDLYIRSLAIAAVNTLEGCATVVTLLFVIRGVEVLVGCPTVIWLVACDTGTDDMVFVGAAAVVALVRLVSCCAAVLVGAVTAGVVTTGGITGAVAVGVVTGVVAACVYLFKMARSYSSEGEAASSCSIAKRYLGWNRKSRTCSDGVAVGLGAGAAGVVSAVRSCAAVLTGVVTGENLSSRCCSA